MERNEQQGPSGGVTPHIIIRDRRAAEAVDFYTRAFAGRELHRQAVEDGRLMHCHMQLNGGSLMLVDDFPEYRDGQSASRPEGVTLHLQVEDADTVWNQALEAGATVVMPLADQFWGDRYGIMEDPFGHRWSIGAPVRQAG